jgi:hypothetical protein
MSLAQQDKKVKKEKAVVTKKGNPAQVLRTAENKGKKLAKDMRRQQALKVPKTERGTVRRWRRERWAQVRTKTTKILVRNIHDPVESKKQGKIVLRPITTKEETWSPTFAEYTAQQKAARA